MIDLFGYERPALGKLINHVAKLSGVQRRELASMGRKARAAKKAMLRRLVREANAEQRRLVSEMEPSQ
jgi:hypothetical protein